MFSFKLPKVPWDEPLTSAAWDGWLEIVLFFCLGLIVLFCFVVWPAMMWARESLG